MKILFLFIFLFITPAKVLASEIVINEIMAKPDDETEWVELYNPTPSSIDLTNWKIKDGNTSTSDDIVLSGQITAGGFITFDHSKGWLNDSGIETVSLFNGDAVIDSYQYEGTTQGKSFARTPDAQTWIDDSSPTKNSTNGNPTPTPSPIPTSTSSPTSVPTPTPTSAPTASTQPSQFVISDIPSRINSDQPFTIKMSLSIPASPGTDYFMKGAFKKAGGSRYFGLTKKDNDWIEYGDENTDQYKITTNSSGQWSGNIEIKPDIYDNDFKGSGDYTFKIGRLTSSSSQPIWSNEVTIKIIHPTTEQNTPAPSSSPNTIISDDETTTKTSPVPKIKNTSIKIASIAGIASSSSSSAEEPVDIENPPQTNKQGFNFLTFFGGIITVTGFTSLGFLLLKSRGLV